MPSSKSRLSSLRKNDERNMSRRGKRGKKLGKGGAKCHGKIFMTLHR